MSFLLALAETVAWLGLRSLPLPPDWLFSFENADPPEIFCPRPASYRKSLPRLQ
jgi:hypothetical protein